MNKSKIYTVFKSLFTLLLLASFATACSNSTSSEDDYEETKGFRLVMNGQTLVEQLSEQDLTGEIELAPGQETDLITVYFLDHNGNQFQLEDDELSLGHAFDDEGIVEFEQHAEDGKWSFHLHAETEGITNMRIRLMHGNHSDFTSQNIHVHVEAVQ